MHNSRSSIAQLMITRHQGALGFMSTTHSFDVEAGHGSSMAPEESSRRYPAFSPPGSRVQERSGSAGSNNSCHPFAVMRGATILSIIIPILRICECLTFPADFCYIDCENVRFTP